MMYRFPRFPGGREKAFTASYDDNKLADRHLLEIMGRYGIKCTLNVNNAFLEEQNIRMPVEDTKALVDAGGHEIAQHCDHHIAPGLASPCTVMREVLEGRQLLDALCAHCARHGLSGQRHNPVQAGYRLRYRAAHPARRRCGLLRSLGGDNNRFALPLDWYNWIPTAHHDNPQLFTWLEEFLTADLGQKPPKGQAPLLFYVWGHSFEFDRNNNWERLEELCRRAGGQDEVWYATNIEIYDYLAAYDALQFDVDETLVHNPGCIPVWFVADKEPYCVQPAETLRVNA